MAGPKLNGLMRRQHWGRAVKAVFVIEKGTDSPRISTAHQAIDFVGSPAVRATGRRRTHDVLPRPKGPRSTSVISGHGVGQE